MRVLSFVEGASPRKGGLGLVGVPWIAHSLAELGHQVVLNLTGPSTLGTEHWVQPDVPTALAHEAGLGHFGIVSYPCLARPWAFAPTMFSTLWPYVRQTNFIMLHSLYSFPVLTGYLLARRFHKPYGLWPHGVLAPFQRTVSRRKKWLYDELIGRRILQNASVVFFSARGEREETRARNFTTPSVIIPHGIDVNDYLTLPPAGQFRARYLNGEAGPLVLYVGRLNAKKGLNLLIKAMAQVLAIVPQARLAIVGGGDPPAFAEQVQAWLRENGLEGRAVMPGLISDDEKKQALADADVFVLPSIAENFGFAMFEAMASRVPVIVSDTLNLAGQVQSHGAGLVVPRDPQAFADAIIELLNDGARRRAMGERGYRLARSYSWVNAGERTEHVIRHIVNGAPLPADLTLYESQD